MVATNDADIVGSVLHCPPFDVRVPELSRLINAAGLEGAEVIAYCATLAAVALGSGSVRLSAGGHLRGDGELQAVFGLVVADEPVEAVSDAPLGRLGLAH